MTKPVTAADVIRSAFVLNDHYAEHVTEKALTALREACGGGDIVIRTDGTLWRINDHPHHDYAWHLAPVERGA